MILGAALVELRVEGSRSLKAKRGVVQSIKRRVRNRFNLSIAEVGGQETWQRAVLGLSGAANEAHIVRAELTRALDFIEALHLAEVVGSEIEIVHLPQEQDASSWDEEDGD